MRYRVVLNLILTCAVVVALGLAGQAAPKPQAVQIVAGTPQNEFVFTPKEIAVAAGQPVTVTVINKGKVEHDWQVEGLGVRIQQLIPAGKSATVTFTPSRKGTFEFACQVSGHKEAGMNGVIIAR